MKKAIFKAPTSAAINKHFNEGFKDYEDTEGNEGTLKALQDNELKVGTAFVKQGVECQKAGATNAKSAKYVRQNFTKKSSGAQRKSWNEQRKAELPKRKTSELKALLKDLQAELNKR